MNHELNETHEEDIEFLEQEAPEEPAECGNHELHEAAAEYLTEQTESAEADYRGGEIDPEQLEEAHHLSEELGDEGLQNWLHDEVTEDLQASLDRLEG